MKSLFFNPTIFCLLIISQNLSAQSTAAYNNYDFVPGENVLFDDNFADAQDGEFPPRWDLRSGQAVVNKVDAQPTFVVTDGFMGSPCRIEPSMKTKHYLGNSFTIEFDFILATEENCLMIFFPDAEEDEGRHINFSYFGEISNPYFDNSLSAFYPNADEDFPGKWHHAAIAYRNGQMKIYVDQHRILVIPKTGFAPVRFFLGGCIDTQIRNVKVADGGGMNMLGKIITDGKFVSHAIKFDVNKAVIKGESMGFLNELAKWLKENAAVKLEIGGHTDSDGDDASNLKLSQARADAVKTQLTSMGVDAARLTAKGYGETKPLDSNATPEGKANNRRVELTKV